MTGGDLDAFIYDATVLEYLVGQDEDCKLLTVGSWYATSGYGVGFQRNSKYLPLFNQYMMTYKENGDLDRLQRFWLSGACRPEKNERTSSKPLSLDQFMSAFILLSVGILLAGLSLTIEHFYCRYLQKHLAKKHSGGCCALVSLSMGKSLNFRGAVCQAQSAVKQHRCQDPVCEAYLWKVKEELLMARHRIQHLERIVHGKGKGSETTASATPGSRKPFWKTEELGRRDLTRNHVTSNEPLGSRSSLLPYRYPVYEYRRERHEIAEIETVL